MTEPDGEPNRAGGVVATLRSFHALAIAGSGLWDQAHAIANRLRDPLRDASTGLLQRRLTVKPIALIAASSIAMLAGSFALAQPQPVPPAAGDQKQERTESREQRRDEWRERRAERAERGNAMRERRESLRHADLMERLDAGATRQGERAARSKELADAVRPLWTTLSDEQKTVLRRSVREAMAEGRERFREMRGGWHDNDRGDRGDRGGRRHWQDRDDDRN
jgi:hypothetical protein